MDHPTTSFDHASLIRHTASIDQAQVSFQESMKIKNRYTKRQLLLIFSYIYGNFFLAACVSLQAPFFPKEAELKGATPTEYGLVFGFYELAIIFVSPFVGRLMGKTTPKVWIQTGQVLTGFMTILFGLLDKAPAGTWFVALAFIIRIFEGVGAACFTTPSYTATAESFPHDQATILGLLETAFGLGLICGPTIGGLLYEMGSFSMPFLVLGFLLMFGGLLNFVICFNQEQPTCSNQEAQAGYMKILFSPGIILDILCVLTSLNFIGFNAATLEPHLRRFELSVMTVGWLFVITGAIYAVTTPFWGRLCKHANTRALCLLGCIFCLVGYIIIGPLPMLTPTLEPSLTLVIIALVLIGLGTGVKLVASLVGSFRYSIHELGMPDNKSTFGICSSIYHTATSVGAFLGPTIGGIMLEHFHYETATYYLFFLEMFLIFGLVGYFVVRQIRNHKKLDQIGKGYRQVVGER